VISLSKICDVAAVKHGLREHRFPFFLIPKLGCEARKIRKLSNGCSQCAVTLL
jgi:hypothetical protein